MNPLYLIAAALLLLCVPAVVIALQISDGFQHRSRMVWAVESLADSAAMAARAHVRLSAHHGALSRSTVESHQRANDALGVLASTVAAGMLGDELPDLSAFFPADPGAGNVTPFPQP